MQAPLTPVVAAGPNPILDILKKPQQLLAQAAAAPITALQLPQIPIPLPQKPSIALPTVPAVPVYQFQLPDIKKEIQNIGDQLKNNLMGLVAQASVILLLPSLPPAWAALQLGRRQGVFTSHKEQPCIVMLLDVTL